MQPESEQVAILRIQLDGALRERDTNEASRQRAVELQKQAESQCARAQKERDEARAENERLREALRDCRRVLKGAHDGSVVLPLRDIVDRALLGEIKTGATDNGK